MLGQDLGQLGVSRLNYNGGLYAVAYHLGLWATLLKFVDSLPSKPQAETSTN